MYVRRGPSHIDHRVLTTPFLTINYNKALDVDLSTPIIVRAPCRHLGAPLPLARGPLQNIYCTHSPVTSELVTHTLGQPRCVQPRLRAALATGRAAPHLTRARVSSVPAQPMLSRPSSESGRSTTWRGHEPSLRRRSRRWAAIAYQSLAARRYRHRQCRRLLPCYVQAMPQASPLPAP